MNKPIRTKEINFRQANKLHACLKIKITEYMVRELVDGHTHALSSRAAEKTNIRKDEKKNPKEAQLEASKRRRAIKHQVASGFEHCIFNLFSSLNGRTEALI